MDQQEHDFGLRLSRLLAGGSAEIARIYRENRQMLHEDWMSLSVMLAEQTRSFHSGFPIMPLEKLRQLTPFCKTLDALKRKFSSDDRGTVCQIQLRYLLESVENRERYSASSLGVKA